MLTIIRQKSLMNNLFSQRHSSKKKIVVHIKMTFVIQCDGILYYWCHHHQINTLIRFFFLLRFNSSHFESERNEIIFFSLGIGKYSKLFNLIQFQKEKKMLEIYFYFRNQINISKFYQYVGLTPDFICSVRINLYTHVVGFFFMLVYFLSSFLETFVG